MLNNKKLLAFFSKTIPEIYQKYKPKKYKTKHTTAREILKSVINCKKHTALTEDHCFTYHINQP